MSTKTTKTTTPAKKATTAIVSVKSKPSFTVQETLDLSDEKVSSIIYNVCENLESANEALVYIAKTYKDPKEFAYAMFVLGKYVGKGEVSDGGNSLTDSDLN